MATDSREEIKRILQEARIEPIKGRFYVYERYKLQIQNVSESATQCEQACIELAKILGV